jgi:hypothetical protein
MRRVSKNNKPGDLFCIPAIDNAGTYGLVMGRYIEHVQTNVGHLTEVFAKFYVSPPSLIENIDTSRRLFRPILCSFRFAEIPKWRVLFSKHMLSAVLGNADVHGANLIELTPDYSSYGAKIIKAGLTVDSDLDLIYRHELTELG